MQHKTLIIIKNNALFKIHMFDILILLWLTNNGFMPKAHFTKLNEISHTSGLPAGKKYDTL